jgi:hypothetical protein
VIRVEPVAPPDLSCQQEHESLLDESDLYPHVFEIL